jgi:hypothetical protein
VIGLPYNGRAFLEAISRIVAQMGEDRNRSSERTYSS